VTAVARGSVTGSRSYQRATRVVQAWTALYTRELEPALAAGRRDELASDLWEQGSAGDRSAVSASAVAASIVWRAVRGVPGDLAWRRGAERDPLALRSRPGHLSRVRGTGAATVGSLTTAFALLAIAQLLVAFSEHGDLSSWRTTIALVAGALVSVGGLAAVARGRGVLAGLLLGVGAALVLPFGMLVLVTLSGEVQNVYYAAYGPGRLDATAVWTVVWIGTAVFQLALAGSVLSERRIPTRKDAS
jgi:hypothetical protein